MENKIKRNENCPISEYKPRHVVGCEVSKGNQQTKMTHTRGKRQTELGERSLPRSSEYSMRMIKSRRDKKHRQHLLSERMKATQRLANLEEDGRIILKAILGETLKETSKRDNQLSCPIKGGEMHG